MRICFYAIVICLLAQFLLSPVTAQQPPTKTEVTCSPEISAETKDGRLCCGALAAWCQVPGQPDLFIGRVSHIGTLDECHHPPTCKNSAGETVAISRAALVLYRMDWQRNKLIFVNYILKLPDRPHSGLTTPLGILLAEAYDPFVIKYRDELWVSFETVGYMKGVPNGVNSCMAPIRSDLKGLDLSRLTMPAYHIAATPALLDFHDHLYIYYTACMPHSDTAPDKTITSRGMELVPDSKGGMWGKGSGGRPVNAFDDRLTSLVWDVNKSDQTADHTANLMYVEAFGDKILATACVGGNGGGCVCSSPHPFNPGCWRMEIAVARAPLGHNVFGGKVLDLPSLPGNVISYPRLAFDPSGRRILFGLFDTPRELGVDPNDPQYPAGSITLQTGESIKSKFGDLVMQNQGNLVFYDPQLKSLWGSPRYEKNGESGFRASFQGDGNLVVYRGSEPYWASNTAGNPNATLALSQSAPYVSIVDKQRKVLLYPWHLTPWPVNSVSRPAIPHGIRYIPFEAILKQALQ